ncbi:hypothetical protein, partial [Ralstonia sp.]|uniref:hypothetical protein n=1 Tax=Ralstonia sp. TaxID=54061 RepID=UPI00257E510A
LRHNRERKLAMVSYCPQQEEMFTIELQISTIAWDGKARSNASNVSPRPTSGGIMQYGATCV